MSVLRIPANASRMRFSSANRKRESDQRRREMELSTSHVIAHPPGIDGLRSLFGTHATTLPFLVVFLCFSLWASHSVPYENRPGFQSPPTTNRDIVEAKKNMRLVDRIFGTCKYPERAWSVKTQTLRNLISEVLPSRSSLELINIRRSA